MLDSHVIAEIIKKEQADKARRREQGIQIPVPERIQIPVAQPEPESSDRGVEVIDI